MADRSNLLPGDFVHWVRHDVIVAANVWCLTPQKIAIRFEHQGVILTRYVDPSELRLIQGGRRALARESDKIRPPLAHCLDPETLAKIREV